jgi:hypothetical protein
VNLTLPYLLDELGKIWWQVAGTADPSLDVRWLRAELANVRAATPAQGAVAWAEELQRENAEFSPTLLPAWCEHVLRLQAADANLLASIKAALVHGLRALEAHQADTLAQAGPALLESMRAVATLTGGYYRRLATERAKMHGPIRP